MRGRLGRAATLLASLSVLAVLDRRDISRSIIDQEEGRMPLSRRLTGGLLVVAVAGALAPTALTGRKATPAPAVASTAPAPLQAHSIDPADSGFLSMVDIEALR